jgi:hypothetical protein
MPRLGEVLPRQVEDVMPARKATPEYAVVSLIHHRELVRDCWFEEGGFLVIRQVKFESDGGSNQETKQFRLSPEEVAALRREIESHA